MSSPPESEIKRLRQLLNQAEEHREQLQEQAKQDRESRQKAEEQAKQDRESRQKAEEHREQLQEQAKQDRESRQKAEEHREQLQEQAKQDRESRQKAEEQAKQDRESRQKAEEQAKQANFRTRRTSFKSYLQSCHTLLYEQLQVQHDRSLSTQGSITNPKNKPCPTTIKPWADFPEKHSDIFAKVSKHLRSHVPNFSTRLHLEELGSALCDRPLASEKDLETYQRLAVEGPVASVISKLQESDAATKELGLKHGIVFENHANTLDELDNQVQHRLRALQSSQRQPYSTPVARPRQADQICVYKDADGARKLCMIIEYKAAHKLSVSNLRAGLQRADQGSMNLLEDVINRVTIPNKATPDAEKADLPDPRFIYNSERLVCAVMTQTYSYMLECGLEYSWFTTGEALVMLQIRESEPDVLYYHLCVPGIDAKIDDGAISLEHTSISLALTICILALRSTVRSQKWRDKALAAAHRATIDYEEILRQIPPEERALTPSPSAFTTRVQLLHRSSYKLRPRKARKPGVGCSNDNTDNLQQSASSSSSSDGSGAETPSKPPAQYQTTRQLRASTSKKVEERGGESGGGSGGGRQYCTQRCLLGITTRDYLDNACPNIIPHQRSGTGHRHAFGLEGFMRRMCRQLEKSLDEGCQPLGKQGSRGALFKITLKSHGYTFVAKGTVEAFIPESNHEAQVYQRLKPLQGACIPVYLGSVDLDRPYYLDLRVYIVRLLFISWGGTALKGESLSDLDQATREKVLAMEQTLVTSGILHGDIRPANVLRDPKTSKLMLIDFERSDGITQPVLDGMSRNSNHRCLKTWECEPSPNSSCHIARWENRHATLTNY